MRNIRIITTWVYGIYMRIHTNIHIVYMYVRMYVCMHIYTRIHDGHTYIPIKFTGHIDTDHSYIPSYIHTRTHSNHAHQCADYPELGRHACTLHTDHTYTIKDIVIRTTRGSEDEGSVVATSLVVEIIIGIINPLYPGCWRTSGGIEPLTMPLLSTDDAMMGIHVCACIRQLFTYACMFLYIYAHMYVWVRYICWWMWFTRMYL